MAIKYYVKAAISEYTDQSGQNKKQFFDALPKRFIRKEAIELAKSFNIGERSVGTLLKNCLGTHLIQPEYGVYEKII